MTSPTSPARLPSLADQALRLVDLGVPALAGLSPQQLTPPDDGPGLLVVHPHLVGPSRLAPLLRLSGRPGFVVEDMTDVDDFAPVDGIELPDSPVYVVEGIDRGDDLRGRTPNDAAPEIAARGRTPLLLTEGLLWALQVPEVVEANHCFMTTGSRLRRPDGRLDARTPALWISRGTGRDGRERRGAPKVGWCWAGNHHTWLGIASAAARRG